MKTQTIQQIEEQVNQVEENLKSFVIRQHKEESYGPEQEYTPQSLKVAIKAILTDLRGLANSHNRFVQLSTYNERNSIHQKLTNIADALTNKDYSNATDYMDTLKSIIRNYGIRGSSETQDILEERVSRLNAQCSIAEDNINTTEKIRKKAEQAEEKLQSAEGKLDSLDNTLNKLQSTSDQVASLQSQSQEHQQIIEAAMTSAKSHEEIIKSFVQRVEKREQQLDKQEQITATYQEQLTAFRRMREEELNEAEKLIEQARNALGYKTAEGISAAFNERYIEEKGKGRRNFCWLVGAGIFALFSAGVGYFMILDTYDLTVGMSMARIAIMSVMISAAWFCAAQYVRYRNTLDDYGYKSILAKSMVAFLDQFKQQEEREHYLQTVLQEIHQDPLRKKHDVDTPASRLFGLFGNGNKEKGKRPETQTKERGNNE